MYSKSKIGLLFNRYVDTGDDDVFGELIEECNPIIDIVLKRYTKYSRHFGDMKQEVKLKMWKNLRDPNKLCRSRMNPTGYLWFVIRAYVKLSYDKCSRIFENELDEVNFITFEEWMSDENKM